MKPPALGAPVEGVCFLCGGVRHAWAGVTMCATCSAITPVVGEVPTIDELHAAFVAKPAGEHHTYLTPNTDTVAPDVLANIARDRGVVLDDAAWCAALVMAGADYVRMKDLGDQRGFVGVATSVPRRKTLDHALSISQRPLAEARHTLAKWEQRDVPERSLPFERWLAGQRVPKREMEAVREEAVRCATVAASGVMALKAITEQCRNEVEDDGNDWHADPYLCGLRAGRRMALAQVESVAGYSFHSLMRMVLG